MPNVLRKRLEPFARRVSRVRPFHQGLAERVGGEPRQVGTGERVFDHLPDRVCVFVDVAIKADNLQHTVNLARLKRREQWIIGAEQLIRAQERDPV